MYQTDWGAKVSETNSKIQINQKPLSKFRKAAIATLISSQMLLLVPDRLLAQTPSQDPLEEVPEEVLRAEIYTDARSPIDGKLLSAAEYTELLETLRSLDGIPPEDLVAPEIRQVVDLLKLRKFLRQLIPFIP